MFFWDSRRNCFRNLLIQSNEAAKYCLCHVKFPNTDQNARESFMHFCTLILPKLGDIFLQFYHYERVLSQDSFSNTSSNSHKSFQRTSSGISQEFLRKKSLEFFQKFLQGVLQKMSSKIFQKFLKIFF